MAIVRGLTFGDFDERAGALSGGAGGYTGPLLRVHVLESEIESHVVLAALDEARIDAFVQHHRELAFDGIFIPQRGWGAIYARADDAARASAVIEETLEALRASAAGAEDDPD